MTSDMNATLTQGTQDAGSERLLRDCQALGAPPKQRRSARLRLDEAIGPELARRLVTSLTARSPR